MRSSATRPTSTPVPLQEGHGAKTPTHWRLSSAPLPPRGQGPWFVVLERTPCRRASGLPRASEEIIPYEAATCSTEVRPRPWRPEGRRLARARGTDSGSPDALFVAPGVSRPGCNSQHGRSHTRCGRTSSHRRDLAKLGTGSASGANGVATSGGHEKSRDRTISALYVARRTELLDRRWAVARLASAADRHERREIQSGKFQVPSNE